MTLTPTSLTLCNLSFQTSIPFDRGHISLNMSSARVGLCSRQLKEEALKCNQVDEVMTHNNSYLQKAQPDRTVYAHLNGCC